ncbi:MAG: hypothetical protein JWM99_3026, partial [Verrucomicrobiales bacterium]|nr:hypothetical protein [Verrucomicrobiales bacterium]
RWHDAAGFVGKGGGSVFFSQIDGPSLKLSNIRVSEWDGRSDRERGTNAPPTADLVFLSNRDKVSGKIDQIKDGKLNISNGDLKLNIPLERVTQIFLSNTATAAEPEQPWQVRAFFSGGEKIAFNLKAAADGTFTGDSQNFGGVRFDTRAVRQLQFNLRRPSGSSETAPLSDDDLNEGDE